ncbi:dienelactone hydrolase family protein [Ideonella sp. B7]|uniref:alpha/beta hydrolase n=1 Tax=Ideonella benzenivorans TaxID=2831643 RepID=UPI001CEC9A26|nr:dienelactone hydrolase family protein [Ideonella benzenivorans]MCA6215429.1 dienelactone hydrolase family protein [Ideonella benzenivorans]
MSSLMPSPGPVEIDPVSGLSFRLLQPAPAAPRRLLVLLHGVGGHEQSVAGLAHGVPDDTLVALVRGPLALGPQQFAWFQVAFTAQGPRIVPEQAEHSRRALIALIAELQHVHGVAPAHTVVAGFSQGGIMSASVALSAPATVAGFGLLSGRILPELEPHLAPPAALAGLRGFVGHGEYDSKLPVDWAHRAHQWLDALGVPHVLKLYPIDHGISAEMQGDFLAWWQALA